MQFLLSTLQISVILNHEAYIAFWTARDLVQHTGGFTSVCPQNILGTHEFPIWKLYGVCPTAFCDSHVLLCVIVTSVPTILAIIYCVIICGLICLVLCVAVPVIICLVISCILSNTNLICNFC